MSPTSCQTAPPRDSARIVALPHAEINPAGPNPSRHAARAPAARPARRAGGRGRRGSCARGRRTAARGAARASGSRSRGLRPRATGAVSHRRAGGARAPRAPLLVNVGEPDAHGLLGRRSAARRAPLTLDRTDSAPRRVADVRTRPACPRAPARRQRFGFGTPWSTRIGLPSGSTSEKNAGPSVASSASFCSFRPRCFTMRWSSRTSWKSFSVFRS